jgi:hypothetical protein
MVDLPLVNGASWALELIPMVVETLSRQPNSAKQEVRESLREQLRTKFVKRQGEYWITVQGRILKTEEELAVHIDWTWMDQFAIPMCKHLGILTISRDRYRLTANGQRLAKALRKVGFDDAVRNVAIQVDSAKWMVLRTLKKHGPQNSGEVKKTLEEVNVTVRKDDHLKKYLALMRVIGLVRVEEKHPVTYQLDETRYARSSRLLRYTNYSAVRHERFMRKLYDAYRDKARLDSPYVDIDDLRPIVCFKLNWPEEYFDKRLGEIPLRVGNHQILLSQAAFPRPRGADRSGRYFNYLSMYVREKP